MDKILIENDNKSHNDVSIHGLSSGSGSDIGLELLMNDNKKRGNEMSKPDNGLNLESENLNLDKLLSDSETESKPVLDSIKLIDDKTPLKLDNVQEIKLDEINLSEASEKKEGENLSNKIF